MSLLHYYAEKKGNGGRACAPDCMFKPTHTVELFQPSSLKQHLKGHKPIVYFINALVSAADCALIH